MSAISLPRALAALISLGISVALFLGGAQPIAVNLIPPPWDKLVHCIIFSLLAWAIGVACGSYSQHRLVVAFLASVFVGMLDEWHQLYLPGRQSDWSDLAADIAGSAVGTVLLALGHPRRSQYNDG